MQKSTSGRIAQLAISPGGVPKLPLGETVVDAFGLAGDQHRGSGHGGPERAVCLYSLEVIERLQAEGHPIAAGTAGENVTVIGLDWTLVVTGARLRLGLEVLLEVTRYTTPCLNIAPSFLHGQFARILHTDHPGESRVYARVLENGALRTGDAVELLARHATSS